MPINAAHWSIDRQTKVIDYIGDDHGGTNPTYATTIEFHRWIGTLADDPTSTGDDELDATDTLPSTRATDNFITLINGYSVTAAALEHLYDGSLTWDGGNEIADGIVNFGNVGVMIQLHQNGAVLADDFWNFSVGGADDTSTGAAFLTDSGESWTTDQWVGYVIQNTTDGSHALITGNTTNTITGTLRGGTNNNWDSGDAYLISQGLNSDAANGISHRFMIKTRTAGADVDGRRLLGINRTFERTYGEFKINGTARGNNVLALSDADDLNNNTAHGTVDAFTDVYIDRTDSTKNASGTNAAGQNVLNVEVGGGASFSDGDFIMTDADNHEYKIVSIATDALTLNRNLVNAVSASENVWILNIGFTQIDVDNDTTNEDYYAQWDRGAQTINSFYEYGKMLSADYTAHYIYGIPGNLFRGITHEFTVDTPTGTFDLVEGVSWTAGTGGSAGTGQMLAIDSPTAGTKMWVQLLTGGTPGDGGVVTGDNSGATVTINVTVTDRGSLITTPFVGASTGTALIGSYGLSLQTADLSASDKVFDLTNTQITPPNNVTGTVSGVDNTGSEEDHVLVGRYYSTSDINGDPFLGGHRFTLNTALTADNITSVVINGTIPSTVPAEGWLNVIDDNGVRRLLHFTSWATSTFTVDTTDGNEDFASVNASSGVEVFVYEYHLEASLTTDNVTSIQVDRNIESDSPQTNYPLRVMDDNGRFRLLNYTAFATDTFTVDNTDGEEDFLSVNASAGNPVFIGYIDQEANATSLTFQYVYGAADKDFVAQVRNGKTNPIKEYKATFTVGTNGGSTNAIRTSDA